MTEGGTEDGDNNGDDYKHRRYKMPTYTQCHYGNHDNGYKPQHDTRLIHWARVFYYSLCQISNQTDRGLSLFAIQYLLHTLLHEPLGSARGSADSYRGGTMEPLVAYLSRSLDEVCVGIDAQTFVEEHPAVAALPATHKEHQIMARGEAADIRHTVCHLSADGVEAAERGVG